MKGNVKRGAGFRGALEYALGKPEAVMIGGNMCGTDARALATEFGAARRLRPDIDRPVWHTSLSCPPGEQLTPDQWDEAAARLMTSVGMPPEQHMYTVVRHSDTAHDHAHIIASRISNDGTIWHGQWEARRVHEATQQIEQDMGLERSRSAAGAARAHSPTVRCSQSEREMWAERGVPVPPKYHIAAALDSALESGASNWSELRETVAIDGIELHRSGVGYSCEWTEPVTGEVCAYKASQLGKQYAGKQMAERLQKNEQNQAVTRARESADNERELAPNASRDRAASERTHRAERRDAHTDDATTFTSTRERGERATERAHSADSSRDAARDARADSERDHQRDASTERDNDTSTVGHAPDIAGVLQLASSDAAARLAARREREREERDAERAERARARAERDAAARAEQEAAQRAAADQEEELERDEDSGLSWAETYAGETLDGDDIEHDDDEQQRREREGLSI